MTEGDYLREIEDWRAGLERSLRAERSWLSLVGLQWIRPGMNRLGAGSECDIVLPAGSAPERVGVLILEGEGLVLRVQDGVEALLRRAPLTLHAVRPDNVPEPDVIDVGRLSLMVIARANRWGLRVWDRESPRRRSFPGRDWFPVRPDYLVQAEVEPASGEALEVVNTLGDIERSEIPGWIRFELQGVACSLAPFSMDEDGVFLAFADRTNGISTYPGGRFLHAGPVGHGRLRLDFNRAYNPPCAFTQFATCPLPPVGNHLPVEIVVGERYRSGFQA